MPLTVIKGQILADFVAVFTGGAPEEGEAVLEMLVMLATIVPLWKVYTDGASNRKGPSRDCVDHPKEADNGEIVTIRVLSHQQ